MKDYILRWKEPGGAERVREFLWTTDRALAFGEIVSGVPAGDSEVILRVIQIVHDVMQPAIIVGCCVTRKPFEDEKDVGTEVQNHGDHSG